MPIQYHGKYCQVFTYEKVQVEKLTKNTIERIYSLQNIKKGKTVTVQDTPFYFHVQYTGKPVIMIGRKDGRLYCLEDGYDLKYQEHQASICLRILNKVGVVSGIQSRTMKLHDKTESHKRLG
jgi:hypothetical protein